MSSEYLPQLQRTYSAFTTQSLVIPFGMANLMILFWIASALSFPSSAFADAWVERMLESREHNFGVVESAAKAIHQFPIKNLYKHEIELVRVRSSCGCASASLEKTRLSPGETGFVVADFNTRTFSGSHDSTLTLEASWVDNGVRRIGEATVVVRGSIRSLVSVEPDEIRFSDVPVGSASQQNVSITATGDANWSIKKVQCNCSNIGVELLDPLRTPQQVVYNMLVDLSAQTPPGHINEQLLIIPTDETAPRTPVQISGRVVPEVWAATDVILLGEVATGRQVTKKLVVRSQKPCRIRSVKSGNTDLKYQTQDVVSKRHILTITFQAGEKVGERKDSILITCDTGDSAVVTAYADIVAVTP